jgi:hypothetical protein
MELKVAGLDGPPEQYSGTGCAFAEHEDVSLQELKCGVELRISKASPSQNRGDTRGSPGVETGLTQSSPSKHWYVHST